MRITYSTGALADPPPLAPKKTRWRIWSRRRWGPEIRMNRWAILS